jgi:CO/xanthine dehydrogenase Mo-binding subunit
VTAVSPGALERGAGRPLHHEELLCGRATFVGDVRPPGALAAVVVRSAEAHGRLRAVEAAAARRLPGVEAVLTAADLGAVPAIPIRSFEQPGMASATQPVLAHERVRYVGEPVAVVVAADRSLAEDAAEYVVVEIEPLPAAVEPGPDAELLFERPGGNLLCRWEAAAGDVDAVLSRAAAVVEHEFRVGRRTGVPLETRGLAAEWADGGRRLRIWGPTKFLSATRRVVAGWFELAEEDVDCRRVSVGGMFGVRGELYPEDFLVPWAARVTGRPVCWTEDRREHLLATNHAPGLRYRVQVGVGGDGRLAALRATAMLDMGAYVRGNGGRLALLALEELPGPYLWDATSFVAEGWATSKTPAGSVRAPAALESTFARERAIDLAAARLGLEPDEVRRRSLVPARAMPFTRRLGGDVHDHVLADGDYPSFFERLLEAAGHRSLLAERDRRREHGELVGVGLGLFVAHSGLGEEEQVEVGVRGGRIAVSTAASDVGQGLDRMARLVAAETLGIPAEEIDVSSGSTRAGAATRGTYSSRSTIFVGNAVRDGCERLLREAKAVVAERAGVAAGEVVLGDRGLRAGAATVSWHELDGLAVVGAHRSEHPEQGFGGHVALVSVDEPTLAVAVERLALAYDCGRALEPASVVAQLRGGAVHGLGATLLEELCHDADGQPVGAGFMDYLVPTSAEVPPVVRVVLLDGWSATNPLGVKGAGEAGVIGVGAAVANAVADALGAAVDRLPLSAETLRAVPEATWARA